MVQPTRHLPADLLRTLLTLVETESVSKTSQKLGISKPAVNIRIARLEQILGEPLIGHTRDGNVVTLIGRLVLEAAQSLLAGSGHHSEAAAANSLKDQIRIGVSSIFIEKFASEVDDFAEEELLVSSSVCTELVQSFVDNKLDVVMVLDVRHHREQLKSHIVGEHAVGMVWMKTADFVSHPGQPFPLATWPGDGLAVRTLDSAGSDYRTMFSSNDYFAKLAAVRSGRYISMMPRNALKTPFIEATDDFLPTLPTAHALIAVRGDSDSARMRRITAKLATSHR